MAIVCEVRLTHINQPRERTIKFAGELARVTHQFEMGVLHKHVPKIPQDVLVEPVRADDGAHWVHSLDLVSGLIRASSAANSAFDMTGQRVRLIVWCLDCGPQGRTGPAEMAALYGRPRTDSAE